MTVIGKHLYMKLSLCVLIRCLQSWFPLLIKAQLFYLLILSKYDCYSKWQNHRIWYTVWIDQSQSDSRCHHWSNRWLSYSHLLNSSVKITVLGRFPPPLYQQNCLLGSWTKSCHINKGVSRWYLTFLALYPLLFSSSPWTPYFESFFFF